MGTNKKRHTCIKCGRKRVEDRMVVVYYRKFSNIAVYKCDIAKIKKEKSSLYICEDKKSEENGHLK